MKRKTLFLILSFTLSVVAGAQSDSALKKQTLHGIVKNEKNKPVQNASVIVKGEEKGTVTDSLGFFKIDATPNSVLIINAPGYESAMVPIANKELITAILVKNPNNSFGKVDEPTRQKSVYNALEDFGKTETGNLYQGSALTLFQQTEETQGSRYLYNGWVNGTIQDTNQVMVNTANFVFVYDKIEKQLLATLDKKTIIEINGKAIRLFTLKNEDETAKFVKIPLISKDEFILELVKSEKKYSLYKSINTKFQKANYQNNGIFESGKKYDEFVDEFHYYILFPGGKSFKKVELKKKSVKEALPDEEAKVKQYFSKSESAIVNESFLIGLVSFLNQ